MLSTRHRTSFALDEETAERLRTLSRRWRVSQAEVVRRAVRMAADQTRSDEQEVRERLNAYQASGRLDRDTARAYLAEVARNRANWERGG